MTMHRFGMAPAGGVGMVTRYCGRATICIWYDDRDDWYTCRIAVGGKQLGHQHISYPAARQYAVDSLKAFDEAAQAAISGAANNGNIDESDIDWGDSGPVITRKRARGSR